MFLFNNSSLEIKGSHTMRAVFTISFLIGVSTLIVGCTTVDTNSALIRTASVMSIPVLVYIDPDMKQACINTAANKYYMPTYAISAVDSKKTSNGSTQITMKVDVRDALCTIDAAGNVESFVDTSPKSADQITAEELAKTQLQSKSKTQLQAKAQI